MKLLPALATTAVLAVTATATAGVVALTPTSSDAPDKPAPVVQRSEPGDDHGGDRDRDQRSEPGDDHGRDAAEPGDDHGGHGGDDEPGDDHGGDD